MRSPSLFMVLAGLAGSGTAGGQAAEPGADGGANAAAGLPANVGNAAGNGAAGMNAAPNPIGNNALTPPPNAVTNAALPGGNAAIPGGNGAVAAGNAVAPPGNAAVSAGNAAVPLTNGAAPAGNTVGNTAPPAAPDPGAPAVTGQIKAGVPPGASPGPHPYEMRFQFDQNGAPSMHTFVLKWGSAAASLQSIDVLVSDSDEVIQTIPVPQDRVKLVWQDITEKKNEIKEKIVDSVDYNFDKFADLRLLRQWPYKVGQKYYLVFLFDEHKNQYVLNEAVSALQGPVPDPKTRRIETTELGGFGGGEYVTRGYSINPAGRLKVQSKVTQTLLDRRRLTFMREVRVRIAGELQRVCKIAVLAEGKAKLLWGKRAQCAPFIEKQPPAK